MDLILSMQILIHYFLHLGFPMIIAFLFFRDDWKRVYIILLLTMLVDLDHFLADPIFQANRCSIQFHPLHSYPAIGFYLLLLLIRGPLRVIGIGLLLHMATDFVDCLLMFKKCSECMTDAPAISLIQTVFSWIS